MGGVRVVMAGEVHPAGSVQKMHAQSLHAFESEAPMPLSRLTQDPPTSPQSLGSGQFEAPRSVEDVWPYVRPSLAQVLAHPQWPRVEVVMSHAGVEPAGVVLALVEQLERERGRGREAAPATPRLAPLRGLVVSGTGSGTWAESLREPLLSLMSLGVTVVLTSRVPWGHEGLSGHPLPGPKTHALASGMTTAAHSPGGAGWSQLSPVKARIALALHLLASEEGTA
jgi:L-asparaginase/Glu-tRNA(Gln) amidotransferase subunit D